MVDADAEFEGRNRSDPKPVGMAGRSRQECNDRFLATGTLVELNEPDRNTDHGMRKYLDIDLVWGGFYICSHPDRAANSIIRILDFNRGAYHAALYGDAQQASPDRDPVEGLKPTVGHAPVDVRGLMNYERMELIGRTPLTEECLFGYRCFLQECGAADEEIGELMERLIAFSRSEPLKLRLWLSGDELLIEELD